MNGQPMITCAEVDGMLLDYLEDTLEGASRASMDNHVASCVRCSALMRDIGAIRSEAERLPELAPSRDLWQGISERIAPAVLPLSVPARPTIPRRWIPLAAAAAAALVIGTAGITYVATSRSLADSGRALSVARSPVAVVTRQAPAGAENPRVGVVPDETQTGLPAAEAATGAAESQTASQTRPQSRSGPSSAALASQSRETTTNPSDLAYGDEIQRLQSIITQRRGELDPATVSVIEESLKVIDAAVKQSRAALVRDPKSGFLIDQLNNALDKKVELLRTVALLPSRT
jgi:hypothetical protein